MLLIKAKDQCFVASLGRTTRLGRVETISGSRTSDESSSRRDAETHTPVRLAPLAQGRL